MTGWLHLIPPHEGRGHEHTHKDYIIQNKDMCTNKFATGRQTYMGSTILMRGMYERHVYNQETKRFLFSRLDGVLFDWGFPV